MHTFLFFMVICAGFGLISANISSSTIESDVNEIIKLSKDVKQYTPKVAHEFEDATCQLVSKCCPQMRSMFKSMSSSSKTAELTEQCFGSQNSSNYFLHVLSCSPLMKLTTTATDLQFIKYASIIQDESIRNRENDKLLRDLCTNDEYYSIACDWDDFNPEKTCQQRVLENLAKHGDEIYQNRVQQIKEHYIRLINELKKGFNN